MERIYGKRYNHGESIRPQDPPTFGEALHFWVKLGFISFGGPTGQIAVMQTELVDRRRWISPTHFLHALNYCMLLPGELVFSRHGKGRPGGPPLVMKLVGYLRLEFDKLLGPLPPGAGRT